MSAISRCSSSRPWGLYAGASGAARAPGRRDARTPPEPTEHGRSRHGGGKGLEVSLGLRRLTRPSATLPPQRSGSACRGSGQTQPGATGHSPAPAPSGTEPGRPSARRIPGVTDNRSPRQPRSGGLPRRHSGPARSAHRPGAAS